MGNLPSGAGETFRVFGGETSGLWEDLDSGLLGGWEAGLPSPLHCPAPGPLPHWLPLPGSPFMNPALQVPAARAPPPGKLPDHGLGHLPSLAVTAPSPGVSVSEITLFIPRSLVPAVSSFQQG